ncbi:MAG: cell division protein ZapB [Treponema sp.]|jgi:septal ring factor EnvC (AmiA/AmiB activator)|nr:cell division protein ZapB [Treponema sp.]
MNTLEQVKLLESKVIRAIEYVERVSREKAQLQGEIDSCRKRIDELEAVIRQFKEDQSRIEEGVLSALDRLNQFEDAIERSLSPEGKKPKKMVREPVPAEPEPSAGPSPALEAEQEQETEPENLELLNEGTLPPSEEDEDKEGPENGELDIF